MKSWISGKEWSIVPKPDERRSKQEILSHRNEESATTSPSAQSEALSSGEIYSYEEHHPSYFKILHDGKEVYWFSHEDDARWVVARLNAASRIAGDCHWCRLPFSDLVGHYRAAHPDRSLREDVDEQRKEFRFFRK